MMRYLVPTILSLLVIVVGCCKDEQKKEQAAEQGPLPYKEISGEGDDPGENGPDDSTELNAVNLGAGKVKFTHFTHSSNSEKGYKIPCGDCHHTAAKGEDPGEGCVDCHKVPEQAGDMADLGPDDNLLLGGGRELSVPFNHYTHGSNAGYKVACASCHHTGDFVECSDCHQKIPMVEEGKVVPKTKRAFHVKCKGCHDSLSKSNPDTIAPTECLGCHTDRKIAHLKGKLTFNRAMHLNCVSCHEDVKKVRPATKAPIGRDCTGCHAGGVKVDVAKFNEPPPEPKPEPKPEPVVVAAGDAGDAGVAQDASTAAAEGDEDKGPKDIFIDYAKEKKTGTKFPHHLHQELGDACVKCHHKGLADPTCSKCHATPAEAKTAFHGQCIPCHKENSVPAGCANCHPKE